MVTYYNEKDIISFGNYILSDERLQNKVDSRDEMIRQGVSIQTLLSIDEMLKYISHVDVENWKFDEGLKKSKNFLNTLGVNLDKTRFCTMSNFLFNDVTGQILYNDYEPSANDGFRHIKIENLRNISTQTLKKLCDENWCIFYIHDNSKLMTNEMGIIENLQATFLPNMAKGESKERMFSYSIRYIIIPREYITKNDEDGEPMNKFIDQTCVINEWERIDTDFEIIVEGTLPPKVSFKIKCR